MKKNTLRKFYFKNIFNFKLIKNEMKMNPRKKVVLVGDSACGKSSMLNFISRKTFSLDYCPTTFEIYVADLKLSTSKMELEIWDISGDEDFYGLHSTAYKEADVFLLCYSIESIDSAERVRQKWAPGIREVCCDAKIILVATKVDLRKDENGESERKFVSFAEGREMAEQIQALKFIESSSKTEENLKEIFQSVGKVALSTMTFKGRHELHP